MIHIELRKALDERDYDKICQYLHTNNYEQDSDATSKRCQKSFIEGWKECEKHGDVVKK